MSYKSINANDMVDVRSLAEAILYSPEDQRWLILSKVVQLNLIKPPVFERFCLWIIKCFRGDDYIFAFYNVMGKHFPEALEERLHDVIRHCVLGTDDEDEDSVGGWSQREIDSLLSVVKFDRLKIS